MLNLDATLCGAGARPPLDSPSEARVANPHWRV